MRLITPLVLAGAILTAPSVAPLPLAVVPVQSCPGCTGTGGSASASGGSCGGLITIAVNVQSGKCKVLAGEEPGDIACRPFTNCTPIVTRSWWGLPATSPLDFCVVINGETLCLDPKPGSGPGTGSDERNSSPMDCSNDPSNTRSYTFGSSACGLFASTQARCSACENPF